MTNQPRRETVVDLPMTEETPKHTWSFNKTMFVMCDLYNAKTT